MRKRGLSDTVPCMAEPSSNPTNHTIPTDIIARYEGINRSDLRLRTSYPGLVGFLRATVSGTNPSTVQVQWSGCGEALESDGCATIFYPLTLRPIVTPAPRIAHTGHCTQITPHTPVNSSTPTRATKELLLLLDRTYRGHRRHNHSLQARKRSGHALADTKIQH